MDQNHRHWTTNQEDHHYGKTTEHHQCARRLNHFIDLAHVKYSRQSTFPRKGFHHELMHNLRNQMNELAKEINDTLRRLTLSEISPGVEEFQYGLPR